MATLRVDTISGIGSNGPVLDGDLNFNSQNYLTLPKGTTTERFPNFAEHLTRNVYQTTPLQKPILENSLPCNNPHPECHETRQSFLFADLGFHIEKLFQY